MGIVASETVRRCFEIFLAFRGVEARDSTIWRRVAQDLKGGQGERTYPSLHPSTSDGNRRCLLGMCSGIDHCVIRIQRLRLGMTRPSQGMRRETKKLARSGGEGGWKVGERDKEQITANARC